MREKKTTVSSPRISRARATDKWVPGNEMLRQGELIHSGAWFPTVPAPRRVKPGGNHTLQHCSPGSQQQEAPVGFAEFAAAFSAPVCEKEACLCGADWAKSGRLSPTSRRWRHRSRRSPFTSHHQRTEDLRAPASPHWLTCWGRGEAGISHLTGGSQLAGGSPAPRPL